MTHSIYLNLEKYIDNFIVYYNQGLQINALKNSKNSNMYAHKKHLYALILCKQNVYIYIYINILLNLAHLQYSEVDGFNVPL